MLQRSSTSGTGASRRLRHPLRDGAGRRRRGRRGHGLRRRRGHGAGRRLGVALRGRCVVFTQKQGRGMNS